ncbi:MAG: putative N-formylglutamate amidohydrolase [Planctomycetota bacterium]|jgi:predicted N-formylglutamate amidohydrolase
MIRYVISCEHATARVPAAFRKAFAGAKDALASHRGSDIGALQLANQLCRELQVPCFAATVTRLLVDTNRSSHHRALLSEWSRQLPPQQRAQVLATFWQPHRDRVQAEIEGHIQRGHTVVHVGVHSFTPCFADEVREIDVAWLYDPRRPLERQRVAAWHGALAERLPNLRLRRNAPYRGTNDGLTTFLRTQFPERQYLGIELEINQAFPLGAKADWRSLREAVCASVR